VAVGKAEEESSAAAALGNFVVIVEALIFFCELAPCFLLRLAIVACARFALHGGVARSSRYFLTLTHCRIQKFGTHSNARKLF